jgi:hypothetical protein
VGWFCAGMKFVDDYKYKHIPFCGTCRKHSGFSVNTTNTIRGAVSFDNPDGLDPTFVANKSTTNIHCNTCGKIMSRFEDINRSFTNATDYEMQFYSDAELEYDKKEEKGCSMFSIVTPFLCSLVFVFVMQEVFLWEGGAWLGLSLGGGIAWLVLGLLSRLKSDTVIKCDAEKAKRKSRKSQRLMIGTSPNNETVVFNQRTGEITYDWLKKT